MSGEREGFTRLADLGSAAANMMPGGRVWFTPGCRAWFAVDAASAALKEGRVVAISTNYRGNPPAPVHVCTVEHNGIGYECDWAQLYFKTDDAEWLRRESVLRQAFADAKVSPPDIERCADDWIGDGIGGYFNVGGWLVYPAPGETDGAAIGWGVDQLHCVPGCHTMPNGDPGYPDEWEPVTVVAPFMPALRSISGKRPATPTTLEHAARRLVALVVGQRLDDAAEAAALAGG